MTDTALTTTEPTGPMGLSAESKRMLDGLMVVRETLAPDLTVGELQLFAMVASRSGLDPFARQVYAVKRKGRMTIQTGIDGYRSIAARTGEYDGQDEPTYGPDCGCIHNPKPHPESATVRVYRKGMSRGVGATAYWHEYVPDAGQSGMGDVMWRKMPHVMIAKVAEALALRKAFPWDPNSGTGIGSDVYTTEEMEQAGNPAPVVVESVQERVAARAADVSVGLSLRDFADAVIGMNPDDVREARAELFPEASGVAQLTNAQREQLYHRLADAPQEAEYVEVAVDATPEPETAPEPAVAACGAISPFADADAPRGCVKEPGHSGMHRSGPREAWPV